MTTNYLPSSSMTSSSGIQLHIPASIVEAIRLPEGDVEKALQRELAVSLYARGLLSFGKARELAALDKASFGLLLGERGIARHFGEDELGDDLDYAGR